MAPVLRTRKAAPASEKAAQKASPASEKKSAPPKRKAAEESSPVSLKKQKSTKPAPSSAKPAGKKAKKAAEEKKKVEEEKPAAEEESNDRIEVSDDDSASDDGEADGAKALAAQIDPEDDSGAKGKSLFKPGQDVGKAPVTEGKGKKGKGGDAAASSEEPGVLYIGRIPHGFYEHEMRQYFSQFGPITKLRLSRNKKTGQSKHFAFVEFAEASTADIVAKTMDNYLLFGHILKCKVLPREQVHADLFKGANRRFKKVPWNKMAGKQLEKPLSETEWKGKIAREKNKRADKAEKLKALGYDFDVPDVKDAPPPPPPAPAVVENGAEEAETKAIEAPAAKEVDVEEAAADDKAADDEETKPAPKAKAAKSKAKATKGKKAKA